MKEIPLTQGKVALVDDADYEELSKYKWAAMCVFGTWYAHRGPRSGNPFRLMHRQILGLTDRKIFCDHINGNGLDNRRQNLRTCTQAENRRNAKVRRGSRSGFKGVVPTKNKKWAAGIGYHGRHIHLGVFPEKIDAAKAYDQAAVEYFGRFARLNFPEG